MPRSILPMEPGHLAGVQFLSASVGWPHRVEDWAMVLDLGHGLVAHDGSGVFGSIMWWPFGNRHATLGLIIVSPDRQGQGHGRRLMEAALAEIGPRTVVLNATREGLPLYAKMGFREVGAVCQHQGVPNCGDCDQTRDEGCIRALSPDHIAEAIRLDIEATGWRREKLLRRIIADGEGLTAVERGRMKGFALCRRFGFGYVIGPVVAGDERVAKALIGAWVRRHCNGFVRVDTPLSSGLSEWLGSHGLSKHDSVVTMARGDAFDRASTPPRVFALASQALG